MKHLIAATLAAAGAWLSLSCDTLAQSAPAAPEPPRVTVIRIADLIDANYYDAARATEIADTLKTEADAGAYDGYADPRLLAAALTRRLSPLDHHFSVRWEGDRRPAAPGAGPRPGPSPEAEAQLRRANYGFARTAILPGGLGYLEMKAFAEIEDADSPARQAADAALAMVANTDAVIIDLRDNGGGAPSMVGYMTAAFTPPGADIFNTFHSRRGDDYEAPAIAPETRRLQTPVFILISARTGSAAEAFAYTMQAAGRATIVGEASAGAANPGGPAFTQTGFSIFISRGSPENPITHANWEGAGVQPDVPTPWDQALVRAQALALQALDAGRPDAPMDLRWALEAAQAEPRLIAPDDYAGSYDGVLIAAEPGGLSLTRGRRPPLHLRPLAADLFFDAGDPSRRAAFARDANGRVVSLEMLSATGPSTLALREP